MTPQAQALLDAHIAWTLEQLQAPQLNEQLAGTLDALLAAAGQLKLNDVVSASAIKDTARHYACDMELGGGIIAVAGAIARRLYRDKVHRRAHLSDLMPDRHVREFVDKLLELDQAGAAIREELINNPLYAKLISSLLYEGIRNYLASSSNVAERIPGGRSAWRLGRSAVGKAAPRLSEGMDESLRKFVAKQTQTSLKASETQLAELFASDEGRQALLDAWGELKSRKLGQLRDYLSVDDLEELLVIAYEAWQPLRRSQVFRDLLDAGIDAFFDVHGKTRLDALLDEIGVTRAMMLADAQRFAPPVIQALQKKGLLEPMLRRQLTPFYRSDAVAGILKGT